ncbi:MAG: ATP-binding protein [Caldilineaceae bacterium]
MHCLQGSGAHRIVADPKNPKRLGIGDRVSELLLPEASFEAIRDLLTSKSFDRIRSYRPKDKPVDYLAVARTEGANMVQSFHESANKVGGRQAAILADICAFANTDGGVVYVGASLRKGSIKGLPNPGQVQKELQQALAERLAPPVDLKFETVQSEGAKVLRISVGEGEDKPYCLDGSKFYVRNDAETDLAVRDEIVALVLEAVNIETSPPSKAAASATGGRRPRGGQSQLQAKDAPPAAESGDPFYLPQMGVELVSSETRSGVNHYVVRDMRNGRTVSNVTRRGARKLWNYAISQAEDQPVDANKVPWKGNVALLRSDKRAGKVRYDLALRENGSVRVFYGVTEDGMEGQWAQFVEEEEDAG